MEKIDAKSIIYKSDGKNWFGIDYTMNIYRGCCYGCIYCDSRSSCYNIENFDNVKLKANFASVLEMQLRSKRNTGVIGIGSMSDTYNPFEREFGATRKALEIIQKYGFGVSIDTKSSLISRDLYLLKEISNNAPVIAKITITSLNEHVAKFLEPKAEPPEKRLYALRELRSAGIFSGVLLMPVVPFITDNEENIISIVDKATENGANFIFPGFAVTLRENQREYFLNKLDNGLKQKYIDTYGLKYVCKSLKAEKLREMFEERCREKNILYKMEDIIKAYKKDRFQQMSLF
ncbi:MAG: radical SAM protein [Firmicutes bacterium]|nr:radical SAM protein [Bacillota bacterium]